MVFLSVRPVLDVPQVLTVRFGFILSPLPGVDAAGTGSIEESLVLPQVGSSAEDACPPPTRNLDFTGVLLRGSSASASGFLSRSCEGSERDRLIMPQFSASTLDACESQ